MPRRKRSSQENQSRSSLSINKDKPQQRYAANARERARMRVLSRAFCRLKTTLPWVPADTKLSKLDTLRLAASYIAHLKGILRDETLGSSESSLHPAMSMTWPFGFNRPLGGSAGGGSPEGGSILGSDVDDDDVLDDDDDDGESISSCTWEEVSPSSTAKDCVHLDTTPRKSSTRRGAKARGKGNSNNNNNRVNVVTRADAQVQRKEAPTYNLSKQSLTNNNVTIRPLSQNLQQQQEDHRHFQHEHHNFHTGNTIALQHHHHHQNIQEVVKPNDSTTLNTMMAATNLENAPPPPLQPSLASSHQHHDHTELFVGVGNNESFLTDMNNGGYSTGTAESMHHLNHHQQHNNNDVHHHLPYAYGNTDLISIG